MSRFHLLFLSLVVSIAVLGEPPKADDLFIHVSTHCIGFGGAPVSYTWSQPQSGVAVIASEKLTLRGDVLLHKGRTVKTEIEEATFKHEAQKTLLELKLGDSKNAAYLAKGKVVAKAGPTLWEGIVECQKVEEKFKALP